MPEVEIARIGRCEVCERDGVRVRSIQGINPSSSRLVCTRSVCTDEPSCKVAFLALRPGSSGGATP